MDNNKFDKFRALLMQAKDEAVETFKLHSRNVPTEVGDMVDKSGILQRFAIDEVISGNEDKIMRNIENALQRIENGKYFNCSACDAEIGEDRLEANPAVSLCISCQREIEDKIVKKR